MSLKANWHVEALLADADDSDDDTGPRVEDVGKPIELDADEPRLVTQLVDLVDREKELHRLGVTCAIKDRQETCCSACPIAQPFSGTRAGRLCAIGREQEQLVTAIAVRRYGAA